MFDHSLRVTYFTVVSIDACVHGQIFYRFHIYITVADIRVIIMYIYTQCIVFLRKCMGKLFFSKFYLSLLFDILYQISLNSFPLKYAIFCNQCGGV